MAAPGQHPPSAAPPFPLGMTAIPRAVSSPEPTNSVTVDQARPHVTGESPAEAARAARRAAEAGVAEQARLAARMKGQQAAVPPPAAFTIRGACDYSGLNRTALYQAFADGRLTAIKLGRRTLVMRSSIDAMLASLPAAPIRVRKPDAAQ